MILSQVTESDVLNYLRADAEEDGGEIKIMLEAAKAFVFSYTGLSPLEADEHEDLTIALLTLCGEMYDNRLYTVENDKLNPIAKSILDMHSRNLI